ncbi:MAG: adenine phosphoribosyltransferase [candidate division KSB1 bacterium]|nr:adenine phosphoribosyltransferase [candidate division KSB1 bacterium]MDZ7275487.1 adenine phosphoribosyltransferase [candidate division KSB1 bacterium]MDZ7286201.1 adenine phosphoribosyltransferase [candidate division KSB1 bacterium]MDZ7296427.1 adenine phosphoribosyltransferase [candidate division KSB1 bacterium]MDZ7309272.1 adenine phosphoribosyltransferase [candidate division KSB1 bacterium]
MSDLARYIRTVPDFPKPGIGFKDITTLLKEAQPFQMAITELAGCFAGQPVHKVVGIESRGFIFGAPLAWHLGAGFVPARKPGKLPAATVRAEYQLEYGTDALEMHLDAINKGENVLIIDDLLATGGTAAAAARLVEQLGGKVIGLGFLIELDFLNGRRQLAGYPVHALIHVAGE